MYSDKVKQLIQELPNRGKLEAATHTSRVENPVCGDITQLYFRVENDSVVESRFQTYGCPAAIAASAAVTLLCRDHSVKECLELTTDTLLKYLGGLPAHKLHGAELAIDALRSALRPS
ncbi:MAG: iron-sulfur cluster assembly scaffold protein [Acidobacteria bacterium]|nr:iron-sulfur cluster assembly scaffold protein [Acidobacteriota bacterium]